jgi:hypothetical protein
LNHKSFAVGSMSASREFKVPIHVKGRVRMWEWGLIEWLRIILAVMSKGISKDGTFVEARNPPVTSNLAANERIASAERNAASRAGTGLSQP